MVLLGRCHDLIKAYRSQLIASAAVIVVVSGSVFGWQYYRSYQRDLAARDYNQGLRDYEEGRYEAALESFRSLRARDEVPYDALAEIYIANSYIALNQPAKAIETLDAAVDQEREGFLNQVMLVTRGLAQEMNDACDDALQSLNEALDHQGPLRQEAMLGKARCSARLGKAHEALATYKAYLKEFPEGETIEIALRLQQLEDRSGTPARQATP